MKNIKNIIISVIITGILSWILNYFFLPAWNIESIGMWIFVIITLIIFATALCILSFNNKEILTVTRYLNP